MRRALLVAALVAPLAACSPTYDWLMIEPGAAWDGTVTDASGHETHTTGGGSGWTYPLDTPGACWTLTKTGGTEALVAYVERRGGMLGPSRLGEDQAEAVGESVHSCAQ